MMKNRLLIDVCFKYLVLLAFTGYIGFLICSGKEINLPDWVVVIFTLVFQYFFRRSPKEDK